MDFFLPLAGGLVSSLIVGQEYKDYSVLKKPDWSPPQYVFGPVWFILYILMGTVLVNVTNKRIRLLFYINLVLNLLWPIVFFRFKRIKESFLLIILIDLTLILLMTKTSNLLLPVLLWSLYATALNYNIMLNNDMWA